MSQLKLSNYVLDVDRFASGLRNRREELGLTILDLSKKASVAPATVHKLESGKLTVHFDKFLKIVDALNLPIESLLSFRGSKLPPSTNPLAAKIAHALDGGDHSSALRLLADHFGKKPVSRRLKG